MSTTDGPGTVAAGADTLPAVEAVATTISDELPPRSTGRYALGPVIGRGGMGEVRMARDLRVGRSVAVKVLRKEGLADDDLRARFLREARVQGRLEHPAIVPVYDLDLDDDGHPFFVMKRLAGLTLAQILARSASEKELAEQWTRRALLARFVDVCHAIEFAHVRGVYHRDLKPQNIMLGDLGEVYVLDWGVAHVEGTNTLPTRASALELSPAATEARTETGTLLGTPGYMAPEQLRGEPTSPQADVYSLGCVLFEILSGQLAIPRGADAFEVTLAAASHSPAARAPDRDVPPELDALCTSATASKIADRLLSAAALAAGVQRYLDGDRDLARRAELANEHVARAMTVLADPVDSAARAVAIREAGLALALDPSDRRAQAIVARLMLEPPAEIPPAVSTEITNARDTAARAHMRSSALTYLSFLPFLPLVYFVEIRAWWPGAIMVVTATINFITLNAISRRPHASQKWLYVALTIHCVNLAATGIFTSTLLMLPAMAAFGVSAFLSNPRVRHAAPVVVMHLLGVFVPIALELLGWIPSTFRLDGERLIMQPWALSASAVLIVAVPALVTISHVIAGAVIVRGVRRAEEAAQDRLHLHKWHLEQLLPLR